MHLTLCVGHSVNRNTWKLTYTCLMPKRLVVDPLGRKSIRAVFLRLTIDGPSTTRIPRCLRCLVVRCGLACLASGSVEPFTGLVMLLSALALALCTLLIIFHGMNSLSPPVATCFFCNSLLRADNRSTPGEPRWMFLGCSGVERAFLCRILSRRCLTARIHA